MNNLAVDALSKIPALNKTYTSPQMRAKGVVVLGSSKTTEPLMEYMDLCAKTTKDLVNSGYNIITGCGTRGIMGAAYNAAKESSALNLEGKPIQNLSIIVNPLWGDENLEDCLVIGKAGSESERIVKFTKVADNFVIFPGGTTTLQEAVTLVRLNAHSAENGLKKIVLVGKEFFSGLKKQYDNMVAMGLLSKKPDEIFKILSEKQEIVNEIVRK